MTIDNIEVGSNLVLWEKESKDMVQTLELPVKVKVEKCLIAPKDVEDKSILETEEKAWIKENENWYYTQNGVKAKGWIQDNNKWYHLNNEGIMEKGWIKDSGKWYFLSETGSMKTGWILDNGKYYFLNESGEMLSNQYIDGYYLGNDGTWVK